MGTVNFICLLPSGVRTGLEEKTVCDLALSRRQECSAAVGQTERNMTFVTSDERRFGGEVGHAAHLVRTLGLYSKTSG